MIAATWGVSMADLILPLLIVLAGVAWAELREFLPWIAKKVVTRAVTNLPLNMRDRMNEELAAELAAMPGKIFPLAWACSVWWGFSKAAIFRRFDTSLSSVLPRLQDLVLVCTMLILVSPLMLTLIILMKCLNRGPLICRVRRIGLGGRKFWLLKFRTSGIASPWPLLESNGKVHGAVKERTLRVIGGKQAPAIGEFMRKTRLDELPQLLNILRGEMSLVGPPPIAGRIDHSSAHQSLRLRPGICWTEGTTEENLDSFGMSCLATVRIYFALLYRSIRRVLLADTGRKRGE